MPSKSPAQARLMAAIAHGWHKPGGGGPSKAVAREFNQADKGSSKLASAMRVTRSYAKKYADGGEVADAPNEEGESWTPPPLNQPVAPPPPKPTYDTQLSPEDEAAFQVWKQHYAPHDSGEDYDLRGAFQAGVQPDPVNGHWPDTWKKPNHPTFSVESMYAKDMFGAAGRWEPGQDGEPVYVPSFKPIGEIKPYQPTLRDRVGAAVAGDTSDPVRQHLAEAFIGSRGLGNTGMSLSDLTPAGIVFGGDEAQRAAEHNDWLGTAMNSLAVIPAVGPAAKTALKGAGEAVGPALKDAVPAIKNLLDIPVEQATKFQKIGEQAGSNPGGFYRDLATGSDYYIKTPKTEDHVRNEVLAAKLYELAGVPVANPKITMLNGKPSIASPVIHGELLQQIHPMDYLGNDIKGLRENFPVDAWLGNYDAVGTGKDNVIVDANGMAHRIDMGGALRYRAQGKPKEFGPEVKELQSMKDPNINLDASDVFGGNSKALELSAAKNIADIPDKAIQQLVNKYGPLDPQERKNLINNLVSRRNQIAKEYGITDVAGSGPASSGSPSPTPMQINKTHSMDKIVDALANNNAYAALETKKLTQKQMGNIASLLSKLPDDKIAQIHGSLTPKQQANFESWLPFDKIPLGHTIASFGGEGQPKTLVESANSEQTYPSLNELNNKFRKNLYGEKYAEKKISATQAEANKLLGKYGEDTASIGNEIWKIANKQGYEAADAIVEHMPAYIKSDLNDVIGDIIRETGNDPWTARISKEEALHELYFGAHSNSFVVDRVRNAEANRPAIEHILKNFEPEDWLNKKPFGGAEKFNFKNISEDRLRQYGFNPDYPLYKGGHNLFDETKFPNRQQITIPHPIEEAHKLSNSDERAFFMSDEPWVAGDYGHATEYIARDPGKGKTFSVNWKDISPSGSYSQIVMTHVIEAGHEAGASIIIVKNIEDMGKLQNQYLFLDTALLRHPQANFDTSKFHLARPFAGLAGGGIFTYGATHGGKGDDKMNRGGVPKKKEGGGMEGMGEQKFVMRAAARNLHSQGMIKSAIPGRTDKIPMSVKSGSYILPADIPSALGQGNSVSGGKILQSMFSTGPYGMKLPRGSGGGRRGSARTLSPKQPTGPGGFGAKYFAEGGEADAEDDEEDQHIPIIAAGGEYVIHPDVVRAVGHGDLTAGHKVLDQFVLHTRKEHIKTLKSLKGPKKN